MDALSIPIPRDLAQKLRKARRIVVITGAGISAESGVPTFRGKDGLWKNYRAEELATPWAFERDPELVWRWYDWRRGLIAKAKPNAGHLTIAKMETIYPEFTLITQNVDGLHRKAGSRNVIEIHGNLWRVRCTEEGKTFYLEDVPLQEIPPRCSCGALVRPDVVWFGESLDPHLIQKSHQALTACDLLFVIGTSGVVQPVAGFPAIAKQAGATLIEINLDTTPISALADVTLKGKSGVILPSLLAHMGGKPEALT
ncbi:MAG: NAD-dependent deacylase [Deltaproteobacteria bacterium]|nr:MAG: NAD-dependent deacylase [Deltaproteobacteria bacterium]